MIRKRIIPEFKTEKDLYWWIWLNRPHYSEINGERISNLTPVNFMHILPKKTYPELRLKPYNVALVTLEQHIKYDHETHLARMDKNFEYIFLNADMLKCRAYGKKRNY